MIAYLETNGIGTVLPEMLFLSLFVLCNVNTIIVVVEVIVVVVIIVVGSKKQQISGVIVSYV